MKNIISVLAMVFIPVVFFLIQSVGFFVDSGSEVVTVPGFKLYKDPASNEVALVYYEEIEGWLASNATSDIALNEIVFNSYRNDKIIDEDEYSKIKAYSMTAGNPWVFTSYTPKEEYLVGLEILSYEAVFHDYKTERLWNESMDFIKASIFTKSSKMMRN